MNFQAVIKFHQNGESYFSIQTTHHETAHDMLVDCVFSMLFLLQMGDHKFDDDVIDHLKKRVEELRYKS